MAERINSNDSTDAGSTAGVEWVEIIEPKTQQRMFANMVTGECLWDAPLDMEYKKMDSNQWWELYDVMTSRHYYYNAQTGETVWNRPENGDIIPLSRLQATPTNGDDHDDDDDDAFVKSKETSPLYDREYSHEPHPVSPKETSVNGIDQLEQQRSSLHSPDGVSTRKTATLRSKLEGELKFQNRGKSLSHSPTPGQSEARRRTASSNQLYSDSKDEPSLLPQPPSIPVAPAFTPPISRAVKESKEKKSSAKSVKRHSSFSGEDSPKPAASGTARRKTEDGLQPTDLHKYEDLSQHTKGIIIKKKVSIANMLQWTKDPIKQPMIITRDKAIKKECCELFKLVQAFMTDRKVKERDENKLALEIMTRAWERKQLRDELFIQLCRQTTANTKSKSVERGWQLFTIALAFFPPSIKFRSYLEGYLWRHVEPSTDSSHKIPVHVYAEYCHKRVEKMTMMGAKKGLKKPSLDEIQHVKDAPFNPSMFGTTLEEIMEMQEDTKKDLDIPWVVIMLTQTVLRLNGPHTEGIFRVPGDIDEVNALKLHVDKWKDPPRSLTDPHVPASLLKLWFRELEDPLIPENYYQDCIDNSDNPTNALALVDSLPDLNKKILLYLVNFLQKFTADTSSSVTRMGIENLAMVWAPNFLRCPSDDHTMIFHNTRKEMSFLRILLKELDTSEVDNQQSPA